jgi:hypothetical protein
VEAFDMSRKRVATDPATKARALQLAAEVGIKAASEATGVPQGTIKAWRHRSGAAGPPAGADPEDWAAKKGAAAKDAWIVAGQALHSVNRLLAAGRTGDAKNAALSMAIMLDKSAMLEAAAQAQEERRVRLDQERGHLVVSIIELYHDVIGLPFNTRDRFGGVVAGSPTRKLLRELVLSCVVNGEFVPAPPPEDAASEARAWIREVITAEIEPAIRERAREELRAEVEAEVMRSAKWMAEHRGLPPGDGDEDAEPVVGEMAAPRRVYQPVSPRPAAAARPRYASEYRHSGAGRYGPSEFD